MREVPLFLGLNDSEYESLYEVMEEQTLSRGKILFKTGDYDEKFYIVLRGKLKLVASTEDGRENLVTVIGAGEFLGEIALLDPKPVSTTAVALTNTKLFSIKYEEMTKILNKYPLILKNMLRVLATRLRKTDEYLSDLVFYDVPGRVAKSLLTLSESFGEKVHEGIFVAHDLTQEELAQLVGASRETVNKSLAEFAARGWIKLTPRAVTILDIDRLSKRAR